MFTVSSNVFQCTLEQAQEVAKEAGLGIPYGHNAKYQRYHLWEDRQTGGGGCRIVWRDDIAWVSRHSGYAWADMTEEVCFYFEDVLHCKPLDSYTNMRKNPNIYPQYYR